ncbi:MAG: hypothetical protein GWN99_02805 [Gemmatimonadetes bacterium]|uniref:Uncharacterized protein n=1 Tax=Candidatus Kutchimonas denitrificans TaxID=3056748 RepID=A0AAE4Z6X9_9BACT|nr:hypothetical protein [Gemmatimonadota bacterium]NIR74885.1 hypothetical protein [Candidatus Kutchimonas denitrificans]NIR99996.1 hypothetical protein [Gemmatimonadota bacterium]NIT65580.1 hypothetical protein [Gemmatimonadota bacterium]NIU52550.1 hypothetical protein [Gemmatimonadota bacterium]
MDGETREHEEVGFDEPSYVYLSMESPPALLRHRIRWSVWRRRRDNGKDDGVGSWRRRHGLEPRVRGGGEISDLPLLSPW